MITMRKIRLAVGCLVGGVLLFQSIPAGAATKTVTFDWEDGVSTSYGFFAGHGASAVLSNVTTGGDLDYTPNPANPIPYTVTPYAGNRMLEMHESPLSDAPGSMYGVLAAVEHLDPGDTVNYSFYAYVPSIPSPSGAMYVAPNAHMARSGIGPNPPGTGDAFLGGLGQQPEPTVGGGWVRLAYDGNLMGGGPEDPIVFDPNLSFDPMNADALYLRGRGVNPLTLAGFPSDTDVDQNFYIDNFTVTVTSDNPDAVIILPDSSVTPVPEPAACILILTVLTAFGSIRRTCRANA